MKKILFILMMFCALFTYSQNNGYGIELLSGWACTNGYDSVIVAKGYFNNDYYKNNKTIGYSATREFIGFNPEQNSTVTCIGIDSIRLVKVPKYDEKYIYNENGTYVYVNPDERVTLVLGDTIPLQWESTKVQHTVMIYDFNNSTISDNIKLLPYVTRGYSGYHNGKFIYTDLDKSHFIKVCEIIDQRDNLNGVYKLK